MRLLHDVNQGSLSVPAHLGPGHHDGDTRMAMTALLIDGLNLVRRIYAAVPGAEDTAAHQDGVLHSVERSAQRALTQSEPTHALCAFDATGPGWRHDLLPDYKANRPPMPAPLTELLPKIETTFTDLGIKSMRVAGYEADDVLATIAVKIAASKGQATILSTDKSMLSLLRPGVRVRNHFDDRDLDSEYVHKRFSVAPDQIATWLALVGESSQSVPGVKSIGAKTAARLINEYGTLDAILEAAKDMPGRTGEALRTGTADARLSLQLMTLKIDVQVGVNLKECRIERPSH
ncbi:MAG: protein Xni [Gammaproteobacteria bacterium]|jgi:protein Xni